MCGTLVVVYHVNLWNLFVLLMFFNVFQIFILLHMYKMVNLCPGATLPNTKFSKSILNAKYVNFCLKARPYGSCKTPIFYIHLQ